MIESRYIDGVFDEDVIHHIRKHYATQLKYHWKADGRKEYDQGHWNNQVIQKPNWINVDLVDTPEYEDLPEIQYMWNNILPHVGNVSLLRCYCNGYTYGTDGFLHTDDTNYAQGGDTSTVIVYLNEGEWDPDWAGETIIYDMEDEPSFVCKPSFGRMLIFNSQLFHRALPLSRAYGGLRTIITFKTHHPDWTSDNYWWVRNRTADIPHNTNGYSHPNGFFLHSWRVGRILQTELMAKKDTCMAGFYHAAAYGTEFFPLPSSLEPANRDDLKKSIGSTAENLVWEYSQLPKNRNEALINKHGNWSDRVWGRLLQIDVANSWEQRLPDSTINKKLALIEELKEKDEI